MDAPQNNGSHAHSAADDALNACSDTTSKLRARTSTTPRRILPATSKLTDGTASVASSMSAFTPLTPFRQRQTEQNEDGYAHGGAAAIQRSTGSSTDVSESASSAASLSQDNLSGCGYINNPSNRESGGGPSLFHAVVRMMALVEGGIIDPDDPEFGFAVNDALYGIVINNTHRLVYTRQFGLRLLEFID